MKEEDPMKRSRFSDEQIIAMLKENEAGAKVDEICRRHGVSGATFYAWRKKFGGMEPSDASWRARTPSSSGSSPIRCWTCRR